MPTLAKRLKKLRETRRLSMRETAKLIGVPETTYREWEYGRAVRGEPYLKIAKAFGVKVEELFVVSAEAAELLLEKDIDRVIFGLLELKAKLSKSKGA
jgi:transcriptional regulator with XRE-family HTH domain